MQTSPTSSRVRPNKCREHAAPWSSLPPSIESPSALACLEVLVMDEQGLNLFSDNGDPLVQTSKLKVGGSWSSALKGRAKAAPAPLTSAATRVARATPRRMGLWERIASAGHGWAGPIARPPPRPRPSSLGAPPPVMTRLPLWRLTQVAPQRWALALCPRGQLCADHRAIVAGTGPARTAPHGIVDQGLSSAGCGRSAVPLGLGAIAAIDPPCFASPGRRVPLFSRCVFCPWCGPRGTSLTSRVGALGACWMSRSPPPTVARRREKVAAEVSSRHLVAVEDRHANRPPLILRLVIASDALPVWEKARAIAVRLGSLEARHVIRVSSYRLAPIEAGWSDIEHALHTFWHASCVLLVLRCSRLRVAAMPLAGLLCGQPLQAVTMLGVVCLEDLQPVIPTHCHARRKQKQQHAGALGFWILLSVGAAGQ